MAEDATNKVKSLKQELRDAIKLAQELSATPGPELDAAIAKAGELKDQIGDVNDQISIMAGGSKFEKMGSAIGDVGSKILALDFKGASESAEQLVKLSKNINFADAVKGVKDLGSTFMQLGKALLTNPLFLIAAAIALIVIAIVKLMDKIGLLKVITQALGKVFDWLMIPINAIIQGLKDLTDWFGWTNNAAADAAAEMAEATEKTAAAYEEKSDSIVEGYDHEIRMAELAGESTREAELKKAYHILNTAKARAKADIAAYQSAKLQGDLDEKELADLKKKADASYLTVEKSGNAIVELKEGFRQEDKKARDKKDQDDLDKQDDKDKKLADKQIKAAEDAKRRREEERKARIAADLYLEDLVLANMQEGIDKELAMNESKYERLREANAANLLITAKQREAIDLQLKEEAFINEKAILKKEADELLSMTTAFNNQLTDLTKNKNITRIQELEDVYSTELVGFKKQLDDKLITQEQYNELEKAALDKKNKDIEALKLEYVTRDRVAEASMMEDGLAKKLEQIAIAREQELAALDLTELEKKAIKDKYRKDEEDAQKNADEEEKKRKIKLAMDTLDATKQGLQGISDIVGAFAGKSKAAQKRAFETQKKLNIAMATIDTIKGAVSAFNSMQNGTPVGIALGVIAAAGVTASGVANIKKISSTQFDSGSSGGAGASVPSVNTSAPAQPSFSLIGNANEGNNATSQQSAEQNGNMSMTVNAVVSEVEITETQKRVAQYEKNAEL